MSRLGEVFLGIIALATLTTALLELVVIVGLVRTARRTMRAIDRLSKQISPIRAHATAVGDNLSRALTLASAQLDRVATAYVLLARPIERFATALAVARGVAQVFGRRPSRRARDRSSPPD